MSLEERALRHKTFWYLIRAVVLICAIVFIYLSVRELAGKETDASIRVILSESKRQGIIGAISLGAVALLLVVSVSGIVGNRTIVKDLKARNKELEDRERSRQRQRARRRQRRK